MSKVLFFGEPLIRITPSDYDHLNNKAKTDMFFGGSEVNIARALQGFGQDSRLLTALPDNYMGEQFTRFLTESHIDCSLIQKQGDRIGIYYFENTVGCRQGEVIYDRKNSSLHDFQVNNINYDKLFQDVSLFHFSGITLSLSENMRSITETLVIEAKKRGILISLDLNFRSHLISVLEAKKFFSHFAESVDICFGIEPLMLDENDLTLFNRDAASESDIKSRMASLSEKYGFKTIFHTSRSQDEYGRNNYSAYLYQDNSQFEPSKKMTTQLIERVGSGDAFVAGALYQLIQGKAAAETVDFAVASASLKCTIQGDNMFETVDTVNRVLNLSKDIVR